MPGDETMGEMDREAWTYCEKMLPLVSRTFALNIRQLTGTLYRAVLIGYLLFRMADTVEDSPHLSEAAKIWGLRRFAEIFQENLLSPHKYEALVQPVLAVVDSSTPEGDLLRNGFQVVTCYLALPEIYRDKIGTAIQESARGMARYQERRQKEGGEIFQIEDWNDLTRYCYYVAGVVGRMLTNLFCLETGLVSRREVLARNAIHFGLALQMTNITKDYPSDVARGWCYLPKTLTMQLGVTPRGILEDTIRKRPEVTRLMIKRIRPHLEGACQYITEIPLVLRSIRMFCIIPFILACHTLAYLRETQNPKLSRAYVSRLLERSEDISRSNARLREEYHKALSVMLR